MIDPARLRDASNHLSAADDLLSAEIARGDRDTQVRLMVIGKRLLAARGMLAVVEMQIELVGNV